MKYAVAHLSYFDNDLQITSVEADDPITALIEGVRILIKAPDDDEWLNSFLKDIPSPDKYGARIEEIREAFFDADQAVSEPMPIG